MNWAYIAGFFDGEGSTGLYGRGESSSHGRVVASMAQNDRAVLEEMQRFLAAEGIKSVISARLGSSLTRNPGFALVISSLSAVAFLGRLLPYLHVKKTRVQDILRWKRLFPRYTTLARSTIAKDWRRKKVAA